MRRWSVLTSKQSIIRLCDNSLVALHVRKNMMNRLSRRDVLETTLTGMLAAAVTAPVCAMTGSQDKVADGLVLGFSTYGMKTLKTEAAIRHIAAIGYDSVEITVWPDWDAAPANMSAARRAEVSRQIKDSGLRLTSLMEHVTPSADSRQQSDNRTRLKSVFELAQDLKNAGPPLVQTVLGGGKWEQKRQLLRDRVGAWTELAAEYNTVLAIKPHRGGVMSRPDEAVWLIEQLGEPDNLKIVYDYSHYAFRDMSLMETVRTALPFLGHVAVKDPVRERDRVVFKLPGEAGTVPYPALLKQLFDGGYRGDISCEVSGMVWKKPGYEPLAAAKKCYKTLAEAFVRAGVPRPAR